MKFHAYLECRQEGYKNQRYNDEKQPLTSFLDAKTPRELTRECLQALCFHPVFHPCSI